ncbi:hypothetical protein V8F33_005167 [Rhypophila sp. PSN 637]
MGPWTGSGPIVTGSCSTAAWTLFDLSTAYLWAPVIGCLPEKPDCCPSSYVFATMAAPPPGITTDPISVTLSTTLTADVDENATPSIPPPVRQTLFHGDSSSFITSAAEAKVTVKLENPCDNVTGLCFDPTGTSQPAGATTLAARDGGTPNSVTKCPEDYVSNGPTGCCPIGMTATKDLGAIPVCASKLGAPFPAPKVTLTASSPDKPISTGTDVIYALQYRIYVLEYPTAPKAESGGLSTGAKAGIGAGCAFIALVLLGTMVYFIRKRQRNKKQHEKTDGRATTGITTSELEGHYYDPTTGEKNDNERVVRGRAELVGEDVQGRQRYELSATPLPPSQVYQVVQLPPGQQPHQYQQQQQQ